MPYKTTHRTNSLLFALLCVALLFTSNVFGALTVTVSEGVVDRVVTGRDAQGQITYDLRTTNSGNFKAVWTIPGLDASTLTTDTVVSMAIGDWNFSASLGEASPRTASSWTFIQTTTDAESGREVELGRVFLSRVGTVVTITGTFKQLDSSFVAGEFVAIPGAIEGQTFAGFDLGANSVQRNLYYKGTSTVTNRIFGSGALAAEFPLNSVQITGSTDDVRPTIIITTPKPGLSSSNETVTVSGKAADNYGVQDVLVKRNNGPWFPALFAPASNTWSADVALEPGTNVIRAVSVDGEGGISLTSVVQVLYVFPLTISLDLANGGNVSGVANRQLLVPGAAYTAVAVPRSGYLFNGWSGDIAWSNASLRFVMQPDRLLQANFVTNVFPGKKGTYNGLFFPQTLPSATNAGFMSIALTESGSFGGRLLMEGKQHPFSGKFNPTGYTHFVVSRVSNAPVMVDVSLDPIDAVISGTVSNEFWMADLSSQRALRTALFQIGNATYSIAGRYTMLTMGEDDASINPGGAGPMTISIDGTGLLTAAGTLPDGSPVSQSVPVSEYHYWPFYAPLYGGRGVIVAWMAFTYSRPSFDFGAYNGAIWHKPPTPGDSFYEQGFAIAPTMGGYLFFPPGPGQNIVGWTNGLILLDQGNLPHRFFYQVSVMNSQVRVIPSVRTNDFLDAPALVERMAMVAEPVSQYLWSRFSTATRQVLSDTNSTPTNFVVLAQELNAILSGPSIYDASRFSGVTLSAETVKLKAQNPTGANLTRFNRLLLEDAYSGLIAPQSLTFAFSLANGSFSGSFINPITRQVTPFKGALFQPQAFFGDPRIGIGQGWFRGTNQSGSVYISYREP